MPKLLTITLAILGCSAFSPRPALALVFSAPNPKFVYTDASGKKQSADVVDKYYPKKIVKPFAKLDANIDPKLRRAATIAEERAHAHSLSKCWRFVRSEEHTSELQSRLHLVCRLLLEKKKKNEKKTTHQIIPLITPRIIMV